MNCLLVKAHPLESSLCTHLTEHIINELFEKGHAVELDDLYRDDFSPVLSADERARYYSKKYDDSAVGEYVSRLINAECLILVFPTWWFAFPAILKGWFDRVWCPGKAYDHAEDLGPIKPKLDRLRRVLVVTTLGAPWWVDRLIMRQPVKKVMRLALLGACARKSKLQYLSLYKSEKISPESLQRFKRKIDKCIASWG